MDLPTDTFDTVKGESDSVAGLVLELAGEIPQPAKVLQTGDFEFTVLEVERNRIQKVKVTIKPQLA
jgi:CBS domain containing-hemolysin-like protein